MTDDRETAQVGTKPTDPANAKVSEAAQSIYRYQPYLVTSILSLQSDVTPKDAATHNYLADAFLKA